MSKGKYAKKGSLLLELLLAISLLALVLSVGAQAVFMGLRAEKVSGERDMAMGLASEAFEATRSITEENWQNLYGLVNKGGQHYYATSTVPTGKWTFGTGDEAITLNGIPYTRFVIVDNVSRDQVTRAIDPSYVSDNDDPSTQKVTVTVSWPNADPVSLSEYFYRWKNKVCAQTNWSGGGGTGTAVQPCGTTAYDTADPAIGFGGGALALQTNYASGILTSSVFDSTGLALGGGYHSIFWKGNLGTGSSGAVLLQFAAADTPAGPWNYVGGATCSPADWFNPGAPNTPIELKGITCLNFWNNRRYFRYRVELCSVDAICQTVGPYTPTVSGVTISWSP